MIDLGLAFTFMLEEKRWWLRLLLLLGMGMLTNVFLIFPLFVFLITLYPPDIIEAIASIVPQYQEIHETEINFVTWSLSIFTGLLLVFMQAGYTVRLIDHVHRDIEPRLPLWNRWGELLRDGFLVSIGYASYILILLGAGLIITFLSAFTSVFIGELAMLLLVCIVLPIVIFLTFMIGVSTSLSLVSFSETRNLKDYFRFKWLWNCIFGEHRKITRKWFLLGMLANFGFGVTQVIPFVNVLGGLLSLALTFPVQGHLLGQYARAINAEMPKRKNDLMFGVDA